MALTLLRENCELPEYGWSLWLKAMIPALGEDHDFIPRGGGHFGYRHKNIRDVFGGAHWGNCGIYEWKTVRADQPDRVVYVGSTCRATDTVRARISEYCNHGSHKRDLINDALTWGYELWVRVKPTGVDGRTTAERAENALLAQCNYAWNIRNNGVRSILQQNLKLYRETCFWLHRDGWSDCVRVMVPRKPDRYFKAPEDGNVGNRLKGIGSALPDYAKYSGIYEWAAIRNYLRPFRVVYIQWKHEPVRTPIDRQNSRILQKGISQRRPNK